MESVALEGSELPIIEGDHLLRVLWKGFNKSSSVDPRSEDLRLWNPVLP